MPSYKNNELKKNKWYCSFYYTDYNGKRKRKKKSGFATKREADEFERVFISNSSNTSDIGFEGFYEKYMADQKKRMKEYSFINKKTLIECHILPFFKDMAISDIKPLDVRRFQHDMMEKEKSNGEKYSQGYLKTVNNQLTAMLNYAVKFYGLRENPCVKAGSMGSLKRESTIVVWSVEEFNQFLTALKEPWQKLGFTILYWGGLRISELLALTWKDIDVDKRAININKSFQRLNGKDMISSPKTEKSKREVLVTQNVIDLYQEYKELFYKPELYDRIFPFTKAKFHTAIKNGCLESGVKKTTLHGLRHSHASMLVSKGINIVAIADRLGHENISTTLNIYSHLYSKDDEKVLTALEEMQE